MAKLSDYLSLIRSPQIQVLFFVVFVEPVSLFIMYPFATFMVRDFGVVEDERDLGLYVGLLAASFSIAQFLSNTPWGYVSNRIGRRPVILIGLLGNTLTSLGFGLSQSYVGALASRTVCGLLNGNIAIAKSMIREIVSDEQQSLAFSLFGFAFGIGPIVASAIGGLLANVSDKYPHVFGSDGFFRTFPYFLPCLVSALVSLTGFILGYLYLEETLKSKSVKTTSTSDSVCLDEKTFDKEKCDSIEISTLTDSPESTETKLSITDDPESGKTSLCGSAVPLTDKMINNAIFTTISSYMLVALLQIINQDCLVLLMATDKTYHGFGFTSDEIGYSMIANGALLLICQVLIYPFALSWRGLVPLFRDSMLLQIPIYFATGFLSYLVPYPGWLWLAIVTQHFLRSLAQCFAFTCIMLMINNSAPVEKVSRVNGMGQSGASLVRAIGPAMGGYLWQVSLKNGMPFPLDFHLVFVLLSLISTFGFIWSFRIPQFVESTKATSQHSQSISEKY